MTNIWGFLNQTIYVSSMAAIILGLKWLLKDKLSARWQYGVWRILVFCLFIPAGSMGGYIIPVAHVLLEAVKTMVETGLSSAYSTADIAVYNIHPFPQIGTMPASITDIMFVVYVVGLVLYLIKYLMGYLRLRKIITASPLADSETQAFVDKTAQKYNLASCNTKIIDGLPSAFVFGIIHPVLVLPKDIRTDEKVILHELLHLKNKDLWQNVFWSLAKAFHWPNPFMQFVFRTIHNDMESLCDFRVMELLEGEDRREYGRILLSMTNEKYPSAFGTTSISNGGHFIAERIQAIARFKKYPQGMGVVAVCILALVMPLALQGSAMTYFDGPSYIYQPGLERQMAYARAKLAQCRTVAGALDTFAKAVITDNELYYLAVKPQGVEQLAYSLPEKIDYSKSSNLYYVVNLEQIDRDTYTANIMFEDNVTGLDGKIGSNRILVPVKLIRQNGWKVYRTGDYCSRIELMIDDPLPLSALPVEGYSKSMVYTNEDAKGRTEVYVNKMALVANKYVTTDPVGAMFGFSNTAYNTVPLPHVEFERQWEEIRVFFFMAPELQGKKSAGIGIAVLDTVEAENYFEDLNDSDTTDSGYASLDGVGANFGIYTTALGKPLCKIYGDHYSMAISEDLYCVAVRINGQLVQYLKIDMKAGEIYAANI